MSRFGTSKKIVTGYILLAVVIAIATWQVYDNSRLLVAVNKTSEQLVKRRDVVDSLMCSLLETNNAERSVLLGEGSEWLRFDRSLMTAEQMTKQLKTFITNKQRQQRIDTLIDLLHKKRANTLLVTRLLSADSRDAFYRGKVEALHSGRDSVVIQPKVYGYNEQREKVYEIVKSKRGFFRRLGDAFRRQHADTTVTNSVAPTAEQPASEAPATEQPAAEDSTVEKPATDQPAAEAPATEESTTEQPAAEAPVASEAPASEVPATTEASTTEQPAASDQPATANE